MDYVRIMWELDGHYVNKRTIGCNPFALARDGTEVRPAWSKIGWNRRRFFPISVSIVGTLTMVSLQDAV